MKNQYQNLQELFEHTMQELQGLLGSLSEEQLNQVYIPGKWTPGQLGSHLYKSYASFYIMRGNTQATDRAIDQKLPQIKAVFLDFEKRYPAPSDIIPSDDPVQKEELLAGLSTRIDQQRDVWQHDDLSRICTDFAIPEYGEFTRLEWLGLNTYHTIRHVTQIKKQISIFQ